MRIKTACTALVLLLLCGCTQLKPAAVPDLGVDHTLWNLRISRHGKTVFSGLLLLRDQGSHMKTAVLDSSGITVLTGRLNSEGDIEVLHCLAPARKHNLPEFLGKALAFIYYQPPGKDCFLDRRSVICRSGLWPFSLWTVRYLSNNERKADETTEITLHTPGADLSIRKIDRNAHGEDRY